jgi:hypothetical protein
VKIYIIKKSSFFQKNKNLINLFKIFVDKINLNDLISFFAIYTTIFAGYSFVGNSILGLSLALLVILLSGNKIKISNLNIIALLLLLIALLGSIIFSSRIEIILQNFRYWFGFVIYLFYFKARPDFRLISFAVIRFLSITVLLEGFLINTILGSGFFHHGSVDIGVLYFNFYERPFGFAGIPGSTGAVILVLLLFVEKMFKTECHVYDLILIFITLIVLMSTTGLALFVIYLFFKFIKSIKTIIPLGLIFIVLSMMMVLSMMKLIKIEINQKLSANYIIEIIKYKILQIQDAASTYVGFYGSQVTDSMPTTSGDFGWLLFIRTMGWPFFLLYFLIVYSFYRGGILFFPVLILAMLGCVHYPAMMSPAGQLVMAMILICPQYAHRFRPNRSSSVKKLPSCGM